MSDRLDRYSHCEFRKVLHYTDEEISLGVKCKNFCNGRGEFCSGVSHPIDYSIVYTSGVISSVCGRFFGGVLFGKLIVNTYDLALVEAFLSARFMPVACT